MPPASSLARSAPADMVDVMRKARIIPCTVPSRPMSGVIEAARLMGRMLA